jgi:GntR family transcriptional regulator, transcriptional repressor for pyruvate dehydrogenase complex
VVTGDREILVKALLKKIDRARRTPEVRLPGERELASSFGASRTAVREVLGVLEALRVIERRPQSGIYVRPATSDASIEALVLQENLDVRANNVSYEQAQEARVIHEVEAARLAARRRTRADVEAMAAIIDVSRRKFADGQNLADDDEAFHLALIAAAKNDILLRMAKSLYLITRSVRYAYFQARGHAAASIAEHERLLESVEQRDAERSATLMRKHYAASSARWRKVRAV